jgi:hypothetical protein
VNSMEQKTRVFGLIYVSRIPSLKPKLEFDLGEKIKLKKLPVYLSQA